MLALDLLRRTNRTYAAVQLGIGLACGLGLAASWGPGPTPDPAVVQVLDLVAVIVLASSVLGAVLLVVTGQLVGRGRGRPLQTALGLFSLASNPPLGTAYGLFTLWSCWSHPQAKAHFDGQPEPPEDADADEKARRYHRLTTRVALGFGLAYALLGGGALAALGPLLSWGGAEPVVTVSAEAVEFDGMYGERIPRGAIERVELRDELPTITLRTNGYALSGTLKGWFQTHERGRVKLLLHADQPPWLYLYREDGLLIYGARDPGQTRAVYEALGGS